MIENSIGWLVILSLGTVVGLFITVSMPIIKLTTVLTNLTSRLEVAEEDINQLLKTNKDSHVRIHKRIDNVEKDVTDLKIFIKK